MKKRIQSHIFQKQKSYFNQEREIDFVQTEISFFNERQKMNYLTLTKKRKSLFFCLSSSRAQQIFC